MISDIDMKRLRRCVELARNALKREMNPLVQFWFLPAVRFFSKTTTMLPAEIIRSTRSSTLPAGLRPI